MTEYEKLKEELRRVNFERFFAPPPRKWTRRKLPFKIPKAICIRSTDEEKERRRVKFLEEHRIKWYNFFRWSLQCWETPLHDWVKRRISNPGICIRCNEPSIRMELSNNGVYDRELKNWEWLCRRCHFYKDHIKRFWHSPEARKKAIETRKRNKIFVVPFPVEVYWNTWNGRTRKWQDV